MQTSDVYQYDTSVTVRGGLITPGEIYHVYTRGVDACTIFEDDQDRSRLCALLQHCLPQGRVPSYSLAHRGKRAWSSPPVPTTEMPRPLLVHLLCYCLMPNHIHLLLRENAEHGTSKFLQRVLNAYAKYFNRRHKRTGHLFSGRYHAMHVESDEQFLHVTRYIHLNPHVAGLSPDPFAYSWSSLLEYAGDPAAPLLCHTELLSSMMRRDVYRAFILDHAAYARSLAEIKRTLKDD